MSDHDDNEDIPEVRDEDTTLNETQPHDDTMTDEHQNEGESIPARAATKTPEEEPLPLEKQWSGTFGLRLPGLSGEQTIKATDPSLPEWLRYVLNNDTFYFQYHVFPEKKKKKDHHGHGDGDGVGEGAGDDAGAAAAATDGEKDDQAGGGGEHCKPNEKLHIKQQRDGSFILTAELDEPIHTAPESPSPNTMVNQASTVNESEEAAEPAAPADEGNNTPVAPTAPSTTAAAAPSNASNSAALLTYDVDILLLAAIKSPSSFAQMLRLPGVKLDTFVKWCIADSQHTTQLLHEALSAKITNPHASHAKLPIDYAPFFEAVVADPSRNHVIQNVVASLAQGKIFPSSLLATERLLVSPDAVWLYLTLLTNMPRSVLISWILPPPEGDEPLDDEVKKTKSISHVLGGVILDVRRRRARAHAGKAKLRESVSSMLAKLLPKKFLVESADDLIVSTSYAKKSDGSLPIQLTVRQSDLLLLALGGLPEIGDDVASLFKSLLAQRTSHPNRQRHDDDTAMWHLMYSHIHHLHPWAAEALLKQSPYGSLFVRGGLGRIHDFTHRFLLESDFPKRADGAAVSEDVLERERVFLKQYAVPFIAKFWPELSGTVTGGGETTHHHHDGGDSSSSIMHVLEQHGTAFLAFLLEAMSMYKKLVADVVAQHPLPPERMLARLEEIATEEGAKLDPKTVFNSHLMGMAIDAKNYTTVKYLADVHKVVTVKTEVLGADVDILEDAIRRRDLHLLKLLVELGAPLDHVIQHGETSGLRQIQEDTATTATTGGVAVHPKQSNKGTSVEAIISHWMEVERERSADPTKNHGLLLSLRSAA